MVDLPGDLAINFIIKELIRIVEEQFSLKVKLIRLESTDPRVSMRYIKVIKQDLENFVMEGYKLEPFIINIMAKLAITMAEESEIAAISTMATASIGFKLGFGSKVNSNVAVSLDFKSLMEFNSGPAASFNFEITHLICMTAPILIRLG